MRTGATTARHLVEESLARIAAHADLNAVTVLRADEALAEADAIDAAVRRGEDPGPLAGLPVLAKDNDDVRGMRTTHGSRWFADAPAAESDGVTVGRLRAAGGIVVGKTNVPSSASRASPTTWSSGPPATRGTPTSPPAVRAAGPPPRSPRGCR